MKKEIIFWQDSVSIHQSALLRGLAEYCDQKVSLVAWEELPSNRKNLGWTRPDVRNVQLMIKPNRRDCEELIARDPSVTKHVFSSSRGHPFVRRALQVSLSTSADISIYTESYDGKGVLGILRLLRSKYDAHNLSRRISFLLAIGRDGINWYTKSGYLASGIFPFGYFVENPCANMKNALVLSKETGKYFDITFIGQLVRRKGWDILLYALAGIDKRLWRLHIVGDGNDGKKFLNLCEKLRLRDNVIMYGVLPNQKAVEILRGSDLLVLPSRWDGWGAVINEALMCGVPVVASNRCGASVLVDGDTRGEVFQANSITDLHHTLCHWISKGKLSTYKRQEIVEWSKCISGESGADYFMAIMKCVFHGGERPTPPWLG